MCDRIPSWNVVHKLEKRQLLVAINCIAALSILFFGYDQGMMSGVNNAEDYVKLMKFGYTKMEDGEATVVVTNSLLQGGIVAVYYLGTLCGGLFGGWLGDRIGRIKSIAVGAVWAILGASLQCSAQNHDWMICGKWYSQQQRHELKLRLYSAFRQRNRYRYSERDRPCLGYGDGRAHFERTIHCD